jgi:hypothetical protein
MVFILFPVSKHTHSNGISMLYVDTSGQEIAILLNPLIL